MWSTGINALTGIIPVCTDHFDSNNFSRVKKPIDHYSKEGIKGTPCKVKGIVIPKVGSLIGVHKIPVPIYSGIVEQNQIHDPDNYEVIHRIEITPEMNVYLNDINIGGAPEYKQLSTGKSKKLTQPERLRFCKGICWFLMNDQICLKDKLEEIGYCAPVVSIPVVISDDITGITGSPYPGSFVLHEYPCNHDIEMEYLESDLNELREYDPKDETGDNHESDNCDLIHYWPDVMKEAFKDELTGFKFYPHLNVSICEVTV
jgi:hypothetical protein